MLRDGPSTRDVAAGSCRCPLDISFPPPTFPRGPHTNAAFAFALTLHSLSLAEQCPELWFRRHLG